MRLADIHRGVCAVLGRDVDRAALESALSANILRGRPGSAVSGAASTSSCERGGY
jgi:hypothetical protein